MEIDKKICPAIVAIGYNRPKSLQRLLDSIGAARYEYEKIPLIISIDKSNICSDVASVAEAFEWNYGEKIIRTFGERQGLRKHVLQCGDLSNQYGAVILLEDDIVVSPEFYNYTVEALDFYKDEDKVTGIALYSHKYNGYARKVFEPMHNGYDTYMGQFGVSWGQCWSSRHWNAFKEWYQENSPKGLKPQDNIPAAIAQWSEKSWGKYFTYYIVNSDKYYVMPYEALATCFADVGEHISVSSTAHQVPLLVGKRKYTFAKFEEAEKYDIFFESITLKTYFPENIRSDLCVDLHNLKGRTINNRYWLCSEEKPLLKIASYEMAMRPKELNVRYQIEGTGIYLYDTKTPASKGSASDWKNVYYDSQGMNWKSALLFGGREFYGKIRQRAVRYLKKK